MTASASGHTYDNDLLGSRTFRDYSSPTTVVKYTWDDLDRLLCLQQDTTGAAYRYRADGMRVQKVEGISVDVQYVDEEISGYDDAYATNRPTSRYFYDGQMPVSEIHMQPAGNSTSFEYTSYVPGPRGLESTTVGTTSFTTAYPLYDCHGNNVANLKKGSSADTWDSDLNERSYDAWGIATGSSPAPYHRYCASLGHRQDDESASGSSSGDGLVYMRARYYESGTGRFISEDPARNGMNWQVYCTNDPVNRIDQTGEVDDLVQISNSLRAWIDSQKPFLAFMGFKFVLGAITYASAIIIGESLRTIGTAIMTGGGFVAELGSNASRTGLAGSMFGAACGYLGAKAIAFGATLYSYGLSIELAAFGMMVATIPQPGP